MIFTAGFIFVVFGWVIINVLGAGPFRSLNRADYFGATIVLIGLIFVATSLCILFVTYLP